MADEFPAGICSRKLWDSTKTLFSPVTNPSPSPIDQLMHPILQIPTTSDNWNHSLLGDGGRGDTTFTLDSITGTKLNHDHQETNGSNEQENRSILKADHDIVFSIVDQPNKSSHNFYDNVTTTCQGSSMAFPFGTISNGYTSTLPQSSLDQPKKSLVNNRTMNSYSFGPIWNASAPSLHAFQYSKCPNLSTKVISCEVVQDWAGRVEKENESDETLIKRQRSDVASPLPTFKVRKEKLGNRITALQQLVSPFGKTDTASVLHEAIEYIKFLHDQVRVLSTPYMKIGDQDQEQQVENELKETKENKKLQDLRSRGLCLVGIPSTVALANGNALDFWSPTFGGTFR